MLNVRGETGCVTPGDEGKDGCDMEGFGTLLIDSSEKTIAFLGDRWWPQAAKQDKQTFSMQ